MLILQCICNWHGVVVGTGILGRWNIVWHTLYQHCVIGHQIIRQRCHTNTRVVDAIGAIFRLQSHSGGGGIFSSHHVLKVNQIRFLGFALLVIFIAVHIVLNEVFDRKTSSRCYFDNSVWYCCQSSTCCVKSDTHTHGVMYFDVIVVLRSWTAITSCDWISHTQKPLLSLCIALQVTWASHLLNYVKPIISITCCRLVTVLLELFTEISVVYFDVCSNERLLKRRQRWVWTRSYDVLYNQSVFSKDIDRFLSGTRWGKEFLNVIVVVNCSITSISLVNRQIDKTHGGTLTDDVYLQPSSGIGNLLN